MDNNAAELKRAFVALGFEVRADPTTMYGSQDHPGRSDSLLLLAGRGVAVEFKSGVKSWNLKHWTKKQRDYGLWLESQNRSELFIGLSVGGDPPHYDAQKYLPRRSYLIPFRNALAAATEAEIKLCVGSIPCKLFKTTELALKDAKLSCEDRFGEWELFWHEGEWHIPEAHPFYRSYVLETI